MKSPILPLLTLLLIAPGCGRQQASSPAAATSAGQAEAPAPAASAATPGGEAAAEVPGAPAALGADEPARPTKEKKREVPRDDSEAAYRDESLEEPSVEGSAFNGAASWDELQRQQQLLSMNLSPAELSCSGALPHRDAICDIAARICDLERQTPPRGGSSHCQDAQLACQKARDSYRSRCQ